MKTRGGVHYTIIFIKTAFLKASFLALFTFEVAAVTRDDRGVFLKRYRRVAFKESGRDV